MEALTDERPSADVTIPALLTPPTTDPRGAAEADI